MKIIKGVEIPISICVSYTILSVANAVYNLLAGRESGTHWNSVVMLLWTSIAVLVLSIHHLFDEWPPIAMIIIQYVIAMGLVLLTVFLSGFFTEIAENGYRDVIISFSVPYVVGAVVYYISLFRTAKRQDKILREIQEHLTEE